MPMDLTARFNNRQAAFNDEAARTTAETEILNDTSRPEVELRCDELVPFSRKGKPQPYVMNSEKVEIIKASVKDIGFITPIIVRKTNDGKYQILSGHHRVEAARLLEAETGKAYPLPAKIIEADEIDDDKAYKFVAESNTPQRAPKPSEICAILNEYSAMKQYKRTDDNDLADNMCEKFGINSRSSYFRYKNLIKLSPHLIQAVDDKLLPLKEHEKIPPRFDKYEMEAIATYIYDYGKEDKNGNTKPIRLSGGDINKLCEWRDTTDDKLTAETVYKILTAEPEEEEQGEELETAENYDIYSAIRAAFPSSSLAGMTDEELDDIIIKQLTAYVETEE